MGEKRMPFTNFKIVNAKKLGDGFKKTDKIWHNLYIHWELNHWLAHRDVKEALWKRQGK